jgi:uncharacterized membrane protein YjjP (DUF1212 family)
MDIAKLSSMVCRLFFGTAFVLLAISVLEKAAILMGYSILRRAYTPGRLLELSALLVVFVIALLLRQIREELKRTE